MRDFQQRLLPFLSAIPFGLDFEPNVQFASASGRPLRLHFARPRGRRHPLPAVVYLFGGGWRGGSPDQGVLLITMLALRGYFAASLDYRLSHEAHFPAQLEDCRLGMDHLRGNATACGLNPDLMGVWGISAGGHLASLLATAGSSSDRKQPVKAVVTWSAPFNLLRLAELQDNLENPNTMSAALIGGALGDHRDEANRANPSAYLPATTPPFLILHGDRDRLVPFSQGVELHEALSANGSDSTLSLLPNKGHGFLGLAGLRRTLAFLDKHLKAGRAG